MKNLKEKQICECGGMTIIQAQMIFKDTKLPYKKAKKLVTGCSKSCCRRPLMALFNMVEFGEVDYEEIAFLIDAKNDRLKDEL